MIQSILENLLARVEKKLNGLKAKVTYYNYLHRNFIPPYVIAEVTMPRHLIYFVIST